MAKKTKVYLRKTDGSGAGLIFNQDDADAFLERNPKGWAKESAEEREANQRAADEQAAAAEAEKSAKKKPA